MVLSVLPFGRRAVLRAAALVATVAIILTGAPAATADPVLTSFDVPTVDADPHGVVIGPDGAVWFTERVAGKIGRLQGGSIQEFDLPDATSAPTGITVGGDGALWFTLPGSNQIGRLTTGGDFTAHTLAAANSLPTGIAAAPDGTIWYTLRGTHRIGFIDGAGMHEVTPGGSVQPTGIAAGPDGGMWYTEQRTNRVGRVDLATLVVTRFPLPAASSSPTAIAAGADGAMWFTLAGSNEIGQIAADGTVATFPIPTGSSLPSSIAPGGPEWMWFSQTGADQIARIALADGSVEEFSADAGAAPAGIVANGTGAWFAEGALNRLTHLGTGGTGDAIAPTIDLRSPSPGAWTVSGGDLVAGYGCADEGGSLLSECAGSVDGVIVADGQGPARRRSRPAQLGRPRRGRRRERCRRERVVPRLRVGLGQRARRRPGEARDLAMAGPADGPRPSRIRSGRREPPRRPWTAARAPRSVLPRPPRSGRSSASGDTSSRSSGTPTHAGPAACRTLTLTFSADGWGGADATFGPVGFSRPAKGWCWWWRG